MASTEVLPAPAQQQQEQRVRRFSLESIKQVGGGKKKKKGGKGKGGGPNSTRRASGQSIQPLQSPGKVTKPALVVVPSASDRFASYDVDVAGTQALEVSEETWKKALDLALLLGKDSRYLLALGLIQKLEAFCAGSAAPGTKAAIEGEMREGANASLWARLKARGEACAAALAPPVEDAGWIFAQSLFGMDTYYKYAEGKLYCKVEGAFSDCAVLDQLAVIREGDLWNKWAPFVSKSKTLARFGTPHADMAVHFTLNMPLMTRDCVFRAYACDNMEAQTILLMGDSVTDLDGAPVPPKPTGWVVDRMDINHFKCQISCTGPTSGRLCLSATLDPKSSLPEALVNFATKQLVGVLIYLLQEASRKITADPARNHHAKKIREHSDFYRHWLLPRARLYSRMHGWDPVPMAALEGFEPTTPGLTPDSHGTTPASASSSASSSTTTAAVAATGAGAIQQQQSQQQAAPAVVVSGNEKAKAKKKRLKFSSLFRKKHKEEAAPPPPPTVAQRVVEAILSPVRLLSPVALALSPKKSARTPASTRGGSPYKRANAPWTFALIVASYFALKASTLAMVLRAALGVAGETVFLTLLMQVVLQLAAVYGFFDSAHVGRIFDDRLQLTPTAARFACALLSLGGGAMGGLMALTRTYQVQISIVPRPGVGHGEWGRATSALTQWWHTAMMAVLVLVVVRPDLARKLVRYPEALLHDK